VCAFLSVLVIWRTDMVLQGKEVAV